VASEGDFALQFIGDLIRGPDADRGAAFVKRNQGRRKISKEAPLNYEERVQFQELMQRQGGETIIEHWKRQKALLASDAKKDLVRQYKALKSSKAKLEDKKQSSAAEKEKRKLEEQFRQIKQARYVPRQRM
jgi:hypothetical protein